LDESKCACEPLEEQIAKSKEDAFEKSDEKFLVARQTQLGVATQASQRNEDA